MPLLQDARWRATILLATDDAAHPSRNEEGAAPAYRKGATSSLAWLRRRPLPGPIWQAQTQPQARCRWDGRSRRHRLNQATPIGVPRAIDPCRTIGRSVHVCVRQRPWSRPRPPRLGMSGRIQTRLMDSEAENASSARCNLTDAGTDRRTRRTRFRVESPPRATALGARRGVNNRTGSRHRLPTRLLTHDATSLVTHDDSRLRAAIPPALLGVTSWYRLEVCSRQSRQRMPATSCAMAASRAWAAETTPCRFLFASS